MKKKILCAAAAAAILLLGVLLLLLLVGNRRGKAETPDPDSRYPYSVRRTGQGMLLTVTGSEVGYRWNAESDAPATASSAVRSRTEQKTEVLICPLADGTAEIKLALENEAVPHDCVYRLSLLLSIEQNGITLLNAAHADFPEMIR